jgi:hypothetical protein
MAERKRGGQPGNRNAVKHGFYSPSFRAEEVNDLATLGEGGVMGEVDMLRVCLRRLFSMVGEMQAAGEVASTLETMASASTTIAGLLKAQRLIEGGQSNLSDALSQALGEVCGELSCANK